MFDRFITEHQHRPVYALSEVAHIEIILLKITLLFVCLCVQSQGTSASLKSSRPSLHELVPSRVRVKQCFYNQSDAASKCRPPCSDFIEKL
jgi:hypothetical protein